jgi:DNA topoisomerase IB
MNLQLFVRDIAPEQVFEPCAAARLADLVYVSDESPGFTRRKSGTGFAYYDTKGRLIRDREVLKRVRSLAVPPAYRNVWICPDPNGQPGEIAAYSRIGSVFPGRCYLAIHSSARAR